MSPVSEEVQATPPEARAEHQQISEQIEDARWRYFVLDDPTRAEVAIAVADRWQHRGVGTAMLAQLMRRAREDGIRAFVASCLVDNREMIGLFKELGESVRFVGQDAGVVELEIALGAAGAPVST
jgi:GNAT superfamily N-acetyltransferase